MTLQRMRAISLWLAPLIAVLLSLLCYSVGLNKPSAMVTGVAILCALWWVFEPIPIPVTSLIPIAVLPILGILTPAQVAAAYGSPLIILLLGGFILSTAMEKTGAHRHIALHMINIIGGSNPKRVVMGFMVTSAALSMWISNTATTLMLLPVALAVLQHTRDDSLTMPLLLGICYGASIGGIGTPIGTPPNLIFMKVFEETQGKGLSFVQWMGWGVPVVILLIPLAGWYLSRSIQRTYPIQLPQTEPWTAEQIRMLSVFGFTALLWVTRKAPYGGWQDWLGLPYANDASIALLGVIAMFIMPNGKGGRIIDWPTANKIPWGMLLLFAGGIALAKGFTESGLASILAEQMSALATIPSFIMILCVCLGVTFLTEVTSNTATTSLLMPVMAVAASAAHIDPLLLMVPAAMSASCAFMLPVATAPNAIIFGSGKVPIETMVRRGFALNVIGAMVISGLMMVLL